MSVMPPQFTRADVERVAVLAQLELEPAELDMFARQLAEILEYANQVQRIDTSGVPPTASVVVGHDPDRPDELVPSLQPEEALANAPEPALQSGLFKVPRVIG
jgi:aspartyl-tRNA(Asn)/glutamyl-tRNA(Gln) amidotransferase subunit C